jgi:putative drug exporter of the RND superfamily
VLERVGRAAARWRFAILAVWAVLAVVGGVFGGGVYDRTQTIDDARGQSAQAEQRLDELDPEGELVVAVISGKDFFARDLIDSATALFYELRELPGVADVRDAYTAGGMQGDDGKSSLAVIELDPALEDDAALEVAD